MASGAAFHIAATPMRTTPIPSSSQGVRDGHKTQGPVVASQHVARAHRLTVEAAAATTGRSLAQRHLEETEGRNPPKLGCLYMSNCLKMIHVPLMKHDFGRFPSLAAVFNDFDLCGVASPIPVD